MQRIIDPKDIPKTLWDDELKELSLPTLLVKQWVALLKGVGLYESALQDNEGNNTGGEGKVATDKYLTSRFTGASSRVELSILDPHNELESISNTYCKLFSGGNVFIADMPCGSGSASLTILSTIEELRRSSILPRIPLSVTILGAEISTHAQEYFSRLLQSMQSQLEEQCINVKYSFKCWDVCSEVITADLINQIVIKSRGCEKRIILIANFSDYLQIQGKFNNAKQQIYRVMLHSRGDSSAAIWIEPGTNAVKMNFIGKVKALLLSLYKNISKSGEPLQKEHAETSAHTKHPLGKGWFRTNLTIANFELPIEL